MLVIYAIQTTPTLLFISSSRQIEVDIDVGRLERGASLLEWEDGKCTAVERRTNTCECTKSRELIWTRASIVTAVKAEVVWASA